MDPVRGSEERKYVQVAQSTINNYAEAVGISGLPSQVSKELAGDVTYRLREIADVCSQFLRHSRKRTLTTEMVNKVFKVKKISPVLGHNSSALGHHLPSSHQQPLSQCAGFQYVPEADLVVDADYEVDLLSESLNSTESAAELDMKVSCNWLAIQGVACESGDEDGKVNPANYNLSPALQQFYTTLTSHIVGESQQLCLMAVQELRRNARLTPLLPYLVTFARWCLIIKYKDNHVLTARIIRLISALISNPHVNLSPKPYLSYLVSALLAFLIKDRNDGSGGAAAEHLRLAASVLSDALDRWATPTNQLSFQTLRALTDSCQNDLTFSQLGALTALHTLGPETIQHCVTPVFEKLLTSLYTNVQQRASKLKPVNTNIANQSLGLVRIIGVDLMRHWLEKGEGVESAVNMYKLLTSFFGDSVLPVQVKFQPRVCETKKQPRAKVRLRLLKKLNVSNNLGGNNEDLSETDSFSFLANMGVPSEIFEPGDQPGSRQDKNIVIKLSRSVMNQFPDAKPVTLPARTIKTRLSACRQLQTSHKRWSLNPGREKLVPWRHMLAASKLKFLPENRSKTDPLEIIANC